MPLYWSRPALSLDWITGELWTGTPASPLARVSLCECNLESVGPLPWDPGLWFRGKSQCPFKDLEGPKHITTCAFLVPHPLLFLWPIAVLLCCPLVVPPTCLVAFLRYMDVARAVPSDGMYITHKLLTNSFTPFKFLLRFYNLKKAYHHDLFYFNLLICLSAYILCYPVLSITIILLYL